MNKEIFKKLTDNLNSPEIQGCLSVINSITGYNLSAADKQPFLYFHSYITIPEPDFITKWRSNPDLEKWYHRFVNGFMGDVKNTFACVLYHYDRLNNIEQAVIENIEKFDYRRILGNSTVAIGNTLIWDFEYQAFILAYRRCLDLLARAIGAYFKYEFHSFRKLGSFLEKLQPEAVTKPLIILHKKYSEIFKFVLSEGDRKSIRDNISHYKYVPVGIINLSQRGFILVGGREQHEDSERSAEPVMLSELLNTDVTNIRKCIREMIYKLIDSIRTFELKGTV